MGVEHQLARLTPQSPPFIQLPGGGLPVVTKEMVAQAAASLDDDLAYHLVMGRYTDSVMDKNKSLLLISKESKRIWIKNNRGILRKKDSFVLLTILSHATYFQNPESYNDADNKTITLSARDKARFCELSESTWHAKWGMQYHDLMQCLGRRESQLMKWIGRNIWHDH